jgi:hypothetical protein
MVHAVYALAYAAGGVAGPVGPGPVGKYSGLGF